MLEYEFDEKIKHCIACKSCDIKDHLVDFKNITISKCKNCGFQFMNPQYSNAYLADFYSQYIDAKDFEEWNETSLYVHGFYLSLIEKYIKPGKLIDIGCGNGHLMKAALNRGWSVHGYDIDDATTRKVMERLGVTIDSGNFFAAKLGSDYDLITMHQVLEHLKNPNEYLEKVHSLIKSGGFLFVAVPNIKSLSSRIKSWQEKIGLRKRNVGKHYDTSHHLSYFEPKTIVTLLKQHGFKVVYKRNCHSMRANKTKLRRFINKNLTDHLFAKSAFLIVAQKT